ncbi:autotransporter outer membrane beta-barrel domain-containing protein [Escherichia coli]
MGQMQQAPETWMQYNWFNASVKGDGLEEEKYSLNGLTASVGVGIMYAYMDVT